MTQIAIIQRLRRPSQSNQLPGPFQHLRMMLLADLIPTQLRTLERLSAAWIRNLLRLPPERSKLSLPALRNGPRQLRIFVMSEVLERRRRRKFLPLKEQGDKGREQRQAQTN